MKISRQNVEKNQELKNLKKQTKIQCMKLFYCVIQIIQIDECLNDYFEIKISIKCQKNIFYSKNLTFISIKS